MVEPIQPVPRVEVFGEQLLSTLDLDPIYVALYHAKLNPDTLCRFLVAYWCFYHVGTASRIASAASNKVFWGLMHYAAAAPGNNPWPRGTERRHFRGLLAQKSVGYLQRFQSATDIVGHLSEVWKADEVYNRALNLVGFGPWIGFKILDMIERLIVPIEETDSFYRGVFRDPAEGAQRAVKLWMSEEHWSRADQDAYEKLGIVPYAIKRLVGYYRHKKRMAPPGNDRPINLQEVETILCKWKSALNGHYYVGKDTADMRATLLLETNPVSKKLEKYLP